MPMIDRKLVLRTLCYECKRCNRIADSGGDPMPCKTYEIIYNSPIIDRAAILRIIDEANAIVNELYLQGANTDYKCKALREKLNQIENIIKGGVNNG